MRANARSKPGTNQLRWYLRLGMLTEETVSKMQQISGTPPGIIAADNGSKFYIVSKQFNDEDHSSATARTGSACAVTFKSKLPEYSDIVQLAIQTEGGPRRIVTFCDEKRNVRIEVVWDGPPSKSLRQICSSNQIEVFQERRSWVPDCWSLMSRKTATPPSSRLASGLPWGPNRSSAFRSASRNDSGASNRRASPKLISRTM